jgi:ketosteroid isomerase-like protein
MSVNAANATTETSRDAAEFVDYFAEGWGIGATDPERFLAHFGARLEEGAAMIQPMSRTFRGQSGLRELFGPLFAAIPDLRGEVLRWGETRDGVLVELRLHGTVAGRPVSWVSLDRITLRDGMIVEREAHFDPLPLVRALVRAPRASLKLMRALLRPNRR